MECFTLVNCASLLLNAIKYFISTAQSSKNLSAVFKTDLMALILLYVTAQILKKSVSSLQNRFNGISNSFVCKNSVLKIRD